MYLSGGCAILSWQMFFMICDALTLAVERSEYWCLKPYQSWLSSCLVFHQAWHCEWQNILYCFCWKSCQALRLANEKCTEDLNKSEIEQIWGHRLPRPSESRIGERVLIALCTNSIQNSPVLFWLGNTEQSWSDVTSFIREISTSILSIISLISSPQMKLQLAIRLHTFTAKAMILNKYLYFGIEKLKILRHQTYFRTISASLPGFFSTPKAG
jgi:hypothetical protein